MYIYNNNVFVKLRSRHVSAHDTLTFIPASARVWQGYDLTVMTIYIRPL